MQLAMQADYAAPQGDPGRRTAAAPRPSDPGDATLSDWQVALLLGGSALGSLALAIAGAFGISWVV